MKGLWEGKRGVAKEPERWGRELGVREDVSRGVWEGRQEKVVWRWKWKLRRMEHVEVN
jgi:hypothetical protein